VTTPVEYLNDAVLAIPMKMLKMLKMLKMTRMMKMVKMS